MLKSSEDERGRITEILESFCKSRLVNLPCPQVVRVFIVRQGRLACMGLKTGDGQESLVRPTRLGGQLPDSWMPCRCMDD